MTESKQTDGDAGWRRAIRNDGRATRSRRVLVAVALLCAVPILAFSVSEFGSVRAQDHSEHMQAGATTEASAAFAAVNAKMHKDMAIAFTGDADIDFVRGMIPHHEGAVAMAEVVIKYGKDPAIRKLAQDIIAAQTGEIAVLNAWLKQNSK